MAGAKHNNKLKRKRGKKFRYFGEGGTGGAKAQEQASNPFEEHSHSKKAERDKLKRAELIAEFQTRGKNNVFVDKRLGGNSALSKMSEEDKMRLRYMREQKEQMRQTKVTKKRAKFNLDDLYSDEDQAEEHLGGFTHGGKPLEAIDDFQDDIPVSSDDDQALDRDQRMGKLNEEMVMTMNFGGGGRFAPQQPLKQKGEDAQKTRKEVFEEIIAKSKAYKAAKYEVKEAAKELTQQLDDQYFDILPLLNMSKVKIATNEPPVIDTYEQIASKLKEQTRVQPSHVVLGEREQARLRKQKLQALHDEGQSEEDEDEVEKPVTKNRREQKELDKREQAVQRILKQERESRKDDIKSRAAEGKLKEQIKKTNQGKVIEVDSDLASEDDDDDEDDASEQEFDEDGSDDDEDEGSEGDDEEGEYDDEDQSDESD